jgi:LysR family transcriptional regulator, regulator of abg operon
MTLQQIRDLIAVITHGGFRAAARALDVSQTGLTKSVARFEEQQGVRLVERRAKGIGLTTQGEEFLTLAQALLAQADRADAWLRTERGLPATSVTLGVSLEPSLRFVPSVLSDFKRVLPGVTLRITQSVAPELIAAVRENKLEFAMTRLPLAFSAPDLNIDVLCESESVIVARAGHACAHARTLRELVNQDWVVLGDRTLAGGHDDTIRELFEESRLGLPRISAVTDSLFSAISMLLESDYLARLPRAVVQHPLAGKSLIAVSLRQLPRRNSIALVHKATHRLSREAQTLAAMLSSFARISQAMAPPASRDSVTNQQGNLSNRHGGAT